MKVFFSTRLWFKKLGDLHTTIFSAGPIQQEFLRYPVISQIYCDVRVGGVWNNLSSFFSPTIFWHHYLCRFLYRSWETAWKCENSFVETTKTLNSDHLESLLSLNFASIVSTLFEPIRIHSLEIVSISESSNVIDVMSVFYIKCTVIKGINMFSGNCFPELLSICMHDERIPCFYTNLLHRNLISKNNKHTSVSSCMQLTAWPSGCILSE